MPAVESRFGNFDYMNARLAELGRDASGIAADLLDTDGALSPEAVERITTNPDLAIISYRAMLALHTFSSVRLGNPTSLIRVTGADPFYVITDDTVDHGGVQSELVQTTRGTPNLVGVPLDFTFAYHRDEVEAEGDGLVHVPEVKLCLAIGDTVMREGKDYEPFVPVLYPFTENNVVPIWATYHNPQYDSAVA